MAGEAAADDEDCGELLRLVPAVTTPPAAATVGLVEWTDLSVEALADSAADASASAAARCRFRIA